MHFIIQSVKVKYINMHTKKPFGSIQGSRTFFWKKMLLGIVVLLLFIWVLNIFQGPIKNTTYLVTAPFQHFFWKTGNTIHDIGASFLNIGGLQQENANLKQENQNLLSSITLLQETIRENQAIQEVQVITKNDGFNLAMANVIGLDVTGDFLMIDKGFDDGVFENMPVISKEKVLYGRVFKAYKNFSEVMLISNAASVVDVKVLPSENTEFGAVLVPGAVKGQGNLSLYLDLVSSDARINQNDVLLSSGLEGVFPKDLLIGKINTIDKNDAKPFQTGTIIPFFDPRKTDTLFIIKDYKQEK